MTDHWDTCSLCGLLKTSKEAYFEKLLVRPGWDNKDCYCFIKLHFSFEELISIVCQLIAYCFAANPWNVVDDRARLCKRRSMSQLHKWFLDLVAHHKDYDARIVMSHPDLTDDQRFGLLTLGPDHWELKVED
jgi:hypothetical protein